MTTRKADHARRGKWAMPVLLAAIAPPAISALSDERDPNHAVVLVRKPAHGKMNPGHGKGRKITVPGGIMGADGFNQSQTTLLEQLRISPGAAMQADQIPQAGQGQMNQRQMSLHQSTLPDAE